MSVLYLHFEGSDRNARVQKLGKSGAHLVVSEPRWPGFFELAKREKPYAIAIDFSHAPSHALETADYLAKAKETREVPIFLLSVPRDRLDIVAKRLPNAPVVTEQDLVGRLAEAEVREQQRAREKKEAAAEARRAARARKAGIERPPTAAAKPSAPAKKTAPAQAPAGKSKPKKPAAAKKKPPAKKSAARVSKKK